MDLSTAGNLDDIRRMVLSRSGLPVGTVPIYQTAARVVGRGGVVARMNAEEMWDVVAGQAEDGVDFMTIHAGLTQGALERLKKQGRLMDIVSRGGSFLAAWMVHQQKENPFYEGFDRLLDLARKHDVTLSLGDGLRPGCLADATDRAQIQELIVLGELADRARAAGVQVMIEGPGHVPLDQVQMNVQLAKTICRGAPLYVLGPLVTDAAAGWDHVAAAIGGAVAGMAGADFLCYVTPSEHLRLPDAADVRAGVIAARIAAHAADLARGNPQAWDRDRRMSTARRSRDWPGQIELALDSFTAASLHEAGGSSQDGVCAMCGPYCALKIVDECLHPQTPPERG
jgi:phosphomethylpyrimidine synthase